MIDLRFRDILNLKLYRGNEFLSVHLRETKESQLQK